MAKSVHTSVRIPAELLERLKAVAVFCKRSVNQIIEFAIEGELSGIRHGAIPPQWTSVKDAHPGLRLTTQMYRNIERTAARISTAANTWLVSDVILWCVERRLPKMEAEIVATKDRETALP